MICLQLKFPAGRYHATPWGRHVNEGDVAWPPEPYRILRALIASWHRKADKEAFPFERLSALIDALTETEPQFHLPESVHAHTRHYMPQAKAGDTRLVIDAFLRVSPDDPLLVGWNVDLPQAEFALLEHLAERLNYFGRAESLAVACALPEWPTQFEPNANPLKIDENGVVGDASDGLEAVDILAPVKASLWAQHRETLLSMNNDKPKSKARQIFEATIPESLTKALSVETADIQIAKWSAPPAGRHVLYARAPLSPTPRASRRGVAVRKRERPTVARFVLAGKPRPNVFDTVKIAETMRLAAMSKWRGDRPPTYISGREENGAPLRNAAHSHAFWLPEDTDGGGLIDHIIVYSDYGFESSAQSKLSRLTHLWIEHGAPDEDGERGRKEWRLALEGFGAPVDFSDSAILANARIWRSATPYLRPRFGPHTIAEVEAQIRREMEARRLPAPARINAIGDFARPRIPLKNCGAESEGELVVKFRRFRSRRGLTQPDTLGCSVRIEFESDFNGPLSLGYGAHFGLGLFVATM